MKLVLGLHSSMRRIKIIAWISGISISLFSCANEPQIIWQIGTADNSSNEFALAPDDYNSFIDRDFGWEDRFFLIGQSCDSIDWPYALPGPSDSWGGTGGTSGMRSNTLNILFGLDKAPDSELWKLIIDLQDCNMSKLPVLKVSLNGKAWKYTIPEGSGNETVLGNSSGGLETIIEIPFPVGLIKKGGNTIIITTLQGSWLLFDQIRLEGPGQAYLKKDSDLFLCEVKLADYQIEIEGKEFQPLLVDVQRYTYPKADDSRILFDFQFPAEYDFILDEVQVEMVDEYHIQGLLKQRSPDVWNGAVQDYSVHFVAEFDQPIKKFGVWTEKGVQEGVKQLHKKKLKDAGSFVEFDTNLNQTVQVRTGISFVSIENAGENLQAEIS